MPSEEMNTPRLIEKENYIIANQGRLGREVCEARWAKYEELIKFRYDPDGEHSLDQCFYFRDYPNQMHRIAEELYFLPSIMAYREAVLEESRKQSSPAVSTPCPATSHSRTSEFDRETKEEEGQSPRVDGSTPS